jgi:hypothetical protein
MQHTRVLRGVVLMPSCAHHACSLLRRYRSIAVANFIGTSYKEYLDCEDLRCLQNESPDELIHVQDTLMAV